MNTAYLLMGGNLGDVRKTFENVENDLAKQKIFIRRKSSLYKTAAWGINDQPDFLNMVLEIETLLSAQELLKTILEIEKNNGRIREEKNGPRVIDIDILFYNNAIINEPDLIVPHPFLQERNFVLYPLEEIVPDMLHPVFHKNIRTLLLESKDELNVEKL